MVLSCQVLRINEEQTHCPARPAVTEAPAGRHWASEVSLSYVIRCVEEQEMTLDIVAYVYNLSTRETGRRIS